MNTLELEPFDLERVKNGEQIYSSSGIYKSKRVIYLPGSEGIKDSIAVWWEGDSHNLYEVGNAVSFFMAPKPKERKSLFLNVYFNGNSLMTTYSHPTLASAERATKPSVNTEYTTLEVILEKQEDGKWIVANNLNLTESNG